MTDDTNTNTDRLDALEARIDRVETMVTATDDENREWTPTRLVSEFGLTRRQALIAIGAIAGGASLPVALSRSVDAQAGAAGTVYFEQLGDSSNPVKELYVDSITETQDPSVPTGTIVMWSGGTSNIPTGWTLCDGTDGAPDLRDRFIVGAGNRYSTADTGGQDDVQLTESEMPSHSHTVNYDDDGGNQLGGGGQDGVGKSASTSTEGGDEAHENRPPYYALAFIYKK